MTAPTLSQKKFYIIKPATGRNYLYKPTFAEPDGAKWWTVRGAGVTRVITGDEQRFGAYSMQVNTATGVLCQAFYSKILPVTSGLYYTFSAYVKATAGMSMTIHITNSAEQSKASTSWIASGYWQRKTVTWLANETATNYSVFVNRNIQASADPYYVDGVQFEPTSVATTLMEGYMAGCRWEGIANDSTTYRTGENGLGGAIIDLEDYCHIVQVTGLGHGDWNQIMTKMTSGGDMYQTHIRKSRNFSIVVDFLGSSLGEIEANRKAVIDLIRPDLLPGQERIVRYQGVDVNGNEATHPVDIKCVPLPASLVDTPDLPSYQRGVLNFAVPSGLLEGAYNEGAELDLYANFPAEFIVKRDPQGKWCRWTGTEYESIVEGMGTYIGGMEHTIMELDDGTIIAPYDITAGISSTMLISYLDENDEWDTYVVFSGVDLIHLLVEESSIRYLLCSAPNNKFYVWGQFDGPSMSKTNALVELTKTGDTIAVTDCPWKTTTTTNEVYCGVISPDGELYIGGSFNMGGSKKNIAKWDGTSWSALSIGLNGAVRALAFAPNGILWIGGDFTNADGTYGDYLCQWDGTTFQPYWEPASDSGTELSGIVRAITFDNSGRMLAGGDYTNAGGNPKADYIARWNGSSWESFGNGVNGAVYCIAAGNREIYAAGNFTSANGMDLADKIAVYLNGAWLPLDVDLPGSGGVRTILPRNDGSLYLAGAFSTAGETPDENAKTGIVALNLEVSSASANTYPFMQIHGPGTLKAITNYSTGKTIAFDGLTLLAGEYINLWFDPLNLRFVGGWKGRGNLMRYVVPGSDYGDFYLRPGSNLISLFMTNSTSDSYAWITWTPLFWGLDGAVLE